MWGLTSASCGALETAQPGWDRAQSSTSSTGEFHHQYLFYRPRKSGWAIVSNYLLSTSFILFLCKNMKTSNYSPKSSFNKPWWGTPELYSKLNHLLLTSESCCVFIVLQLAVNLKNLLYSNVHFCLCTFTVCVFILCRTGEFRVKVTVSNLVSSASLSSHIFVVDRPCQPPPVKNMGPLQLQVHFTSRSVTLLNMRAV